MTARDRLNRAACRLAASDPAYVGFWLARHRQTESLTDDQLAEKLRMPADRLAVLALCHTPRPDQFAPDVTAASAVSGADAGALANLLRQERSLLNWQDATRPAADVADTGRTAKPVEAAGGWMIAAHDAAQKPPEADEDTPDAGRVG